MFEEASVNSRTAGTSARTTGIGWAMFGASVVYALLANFTFLLAQDATPAFFPAAGFTLAVIYRTSGWSRRIALLGAIAVTEVVVDVAHGLPVESSAGFALANVIEPLIGAYCLGVLFQNRPLVHNPACVLRFVAAAVASVSCGAVVGAVTIHASFGAPLAAAFGDWWSGDLLGVLIVAPLVLLASRPVQRPVATRERVVLYVHVGMLAGFSGFAFWKSALSIDFLLIPVVLWIAVRFGSRGAALATAMVAAVAFGFTIAGHAPFVGSGRSEDDALELLQLFLLVVSAAAHLLAAEVETRQQLESALRAGDASFRALVEQAPMAIIEVRLADNSILSWNPAAESMFGWSKHEIVGRPLKFDSVDGVDQHERRRRALARCGEGVQFEAVGRTRDGKVLDLAVAARSRLAPNGELQVVTIVQDITDSKIERSTLAHRANHDQLTGLANRQFFVDRLDAELLARNHSDSRLSVLFCDLDGFKAVNDAYGHDFGDQLLVLASKRISATVRSSDMVGRLGGDEFVVLAHSESRSGAQDLARRLACAFEAPFLIDGHSMSVGISVGVAVAEFDSASSADLLRQADAAMYTAKRSQS